MDTMKKHKGILNTLASIAISSEETLTAKLAAAIVLNNRIVAIGYNRRKSDPLQARFSKNESAIYLHAEIHSLKNSLKLLDVEELTKCSIYICRVKKVRPKSKEYVWGIAKPCSGCMRAIREFGIKNIIYSSDETGKYEVMDV